MITRFHMSMMVLATLFVAVPADRGRTHPGGTDESGCHTCKSNCEKWGETRGERHCHGDDGESGAEEEEDREEEDDKEADSSESEEDSESRASIEEGQEAYVLKVLDGDTLQVRTLGGGSREVRIRILGIDCPESHKNPKCRREGREGGESCAEQIPDGLEAARRAAELVKGEVVSLESAGGDGEFEKGGYDRVLAYIRMAGGRDLGEVLVREGHCSDYGHKYPHPRHEEYERAEGES